MQCVAITRTKLKTIMLELLARVMSGISSYAAGSRHSILSIAEFNDPLP